MKKQDATASNKPAVDLTYGFPGEIPPKEKHRLFLVEFAKCGDRQEAARIVGYSETWAKVYCAPILRRYHAYIAWLQAHRAQAVTRAIDIDAKMVFEEMARIAFANDYDYLHFYNKDEIDGSGRKTGKEVPWARRKYPHELTREQMAAVIVFRRGDKGSLDWKWRDRDGKLFELGKNLGMFNERIIMEHRHRHLHAHFDLSKASMKDLETLEGQFEALLTDERATK